MKSKVKSKIALVLTLVLIISNINVNQMVVHAANPPGSGTSASPYLISTEEQLRGIANEAYTNNDTAYYKLQNDIVLSSVEWKSIGENGGFKGIFDGNGYKITNMKLVGSGMFTILIGIVKKLGIEVSMEYNAHAPLGALVSINEGKIQQCYARGSILGGWYYTGGLVGKNDTGGTIENSYSRVKVKSYLNDGTGGLVGVTSGTIKRCYATGTITSDNSKDEIGGLVGITSGTVRSIFNYYDSETTKQSDTDKCAFSVSTDELKNSSTYAGWDFDNIWGISPAINDGYPYLKANGESVPVNISGSGIAEDPYLITSEQQLLAVAAGEILNAFTSQYQLQNNIILTSKYWTPIGGNFQPKFEGVFDGNGYKVTNIQIPQLNFEYTGFFGSVKGTIKNLGVDAFVKGLGNVGAIAGETYGGKVQRCYSSGVIEAGDPSVGGANGGGLIGEANTLIENCYSLAEVGTTSSSCRGGLVGYGGSIKYCYSAGKVATGSYGNSGGLVGYPTNYVISGYYDKTVSMQKDTGKGIGLITDEMKKQSSFNEWDFADIWRINPSINNGYPFLEDPKTEINKVTTPTADQSGGIIEMGSTIVLKTTTSDASIYYTMNGDTPSTSSTLYTGPIVVSSNVTIKAFAVKSGMSSSNVRSFTYTPIEKTKTPTASISAGSVSKGDLVTLNTLTSGASIYYTTNGSDPTTASKLYNGPIPITYNKTIKAFAVKSGLLDSASSSFEYTVIDNGTSPCTHLISDWSHISGSSASVWTGFSDNDIIDLSEMTASSTDIVRIIIPQNIDNLTITGKADVIYSNVVIEANENVNLTVSNLNIKAPTSGYLTCLTLKASTGNKIIITGNNKFESPYGSGIEGNVEFEGSGILDVFGSVIGSSFTPDRPTIIGNIVCKHSGTINIKGGLGAGSTATTGGLAIKGNVDCYTGIVTIQGGDGGNGCTGGFGIMGNVVAKSSATLLVTGGKSGIRGDKTSGNPQNGGAAISGALHLYDEANVTLNGGEGNFGSRGAVAMVGDVEAVNNSKLICNGGKGIDGSSSYTDLINGSVGGSGIIGNVKLKNNANLSINSGKGGNGNKISNIYSNDYGSGYGGNSGNGIEGNVELQNEVQLSVICEKGGDGGHPYNSTGLAGTGGNGGDCIKGNISMLGAVKLITKAGNKGLKSAWGIGGADGKVGKEILTTSVIPQISSGYIEVGGFYNSSGTSIRCTNDKGTDVYKMALTLTIDNKPAVNIPLTITGNGIIDYQTYTNESGITYVYLPMGGPYGIIAGDYYSTISYVWNDNNNIALNLNHKNVTGITMKSIPSKVMYFVGEDVDLQGAMINISYDNGMLEEMEVTSDMISGYDKNKAGSQTVTVTYQGMMTTFSVMVKAVTVTGIVMKTNPTKTTYSAGEDLDLGGASITVSYSNGTFENKEITSDMISGYDKNKTGSQTVTVMYQGKMTIFSVNAKAVIITSAAKKSLSTPKGLKLSTKKATWKSVSNNNGYTLKIMQGKKVIRTVQIKKGTTSYKIPKSLFKKGKQYKFSLVAKGKGIYLNSKLAQSSIINF